MSKEKVEHLAIADVLRDYKDGCEHGWTTELKWLWHNDRAKMLELIESVTNWGCISRPIILGYDGRVWDGHHRIGVTLALGLPTIPCIKYEDPEEAPPF